MFFLIILLNCFSGQTNILVWTLTCRKIYLQRHNLRHQVQQKVLLQYPRTPVWNLSYSCSCSCASLVSSSCALLSTKKINVNFLYCTGDFIKIQSYSFGCIRISYKNINKKKKFSINIFFFSYLEKYRKESLNKVIHLANTFCFKSDSISEVEPLGWML